MYLVFILFLVPTLSAGAYLSENSAWQSNLTGLQLSALSWGDIDSDNDIDLITMGVCGLNCYSSKVYLNNGTSLTENQTWQQNLTAVTYGSLALGDVDNDGDLDLALSGCSSGVDEFIDGCDDGATKIFVYINNGTSLVENSVWQDDLTAVYRSSLTFGDIDGDGDLDFALTGNTGTSIISKIYINNGTSFVENSIWQNNLTSVSKSSLALGDIDNDGDLDLVLSGEDSSDNKFTSVYLNNGTSLVENSVWKSNLVNVEDSSVALADFDNDGDLDLSLTGCCDKSRIYRNNKTTFIEINREITGGLDGVFAGSVAFGDYDADGYLDLITSGREDGTFLFLYNVSASNFTGYWQDPELNIMNLRYSSVAWVDLDNDNDLDLIEMGHNTSELNSLVYISNRSLTKNNTKPLSPNSSFLSTYTNDVLTLVWGNGSDNETPTAGLYYNLMVGNSTTNHTIVSGIYGGSSNPTAGYFGNMMQRKSITLNLQLEANETYNWYVQTIDTGLAKSNWSAVQSFNTSLDTTKPEITINSPSPNASLHIINPFFTFNITVADANLGNVTLYANWNGTMIANETNSSGLNGTYVFTKNLTNINDGIYSWYIKAYDGDNNSQTSETRTFYLDTTAPIINSISPANASTWTSSSTVTFSYNVTDTDIANCSLIIDQTIDQTDTSITEHTTQTFTKTMSNADYNWNINCTDYVGYTNSSETRTLTVSYTAPTTPSGGGGSSTTTSFWSNTYAVNAEDFEKGFVKELSKKQRVKLSINNETHYIGIVELTNTTATINITSNPIQIILNINEEKKLDITENGYYDLYVKLNSILNNKANLTIKSIYEKIEVVEKVSEANESIEKQEEFKETEERNFIWFLVAIGLIVILIILIKFTKKYLKHKEWKKHTLIG